MGGHLGELPDGCFCVFFKFLSISVSHTVSEATSANLLEIQTHVDVYSLIPWHCCYVFGRGKKTFIIVIAIIFVVCLKGSSHFSVCLGACCGKANNVSDAPLHLSITYPFHYSTDNLSSTDI